MRPGRPVASVTIQADGMTVTTDGPVEAMDAIQRDAFEVRLPEPATLDEEQEAGRVIAEWLRGLKRAG